MRQYKFALTALAAAVLAGCGGGGGGAGDQSVKIKFTQQVSFGDSLSDVGTYGVGTVSNVFHGGKYTVNSLAPSAQNWTELMAAQLGQPAPCPAQTGLNGLAAQGFSVPVANHTGCFGYAQGGARVTNPVGPGNALLGGGNAVIGQLTVPVITQIQNHLAASGGKFSGTEVVFVLAGANDLFIQLATMQANATAAGTAAATAAVTAAVPGQVQSDISNGRCTPTDAQASNCVQQAITELTPTVGATAGKAAGAAYIQNTGGPALVQAMGQAGAELAGYVQNLIVGKGANYVVVVNLPDVSTTPFAVSADQASPGLASLIATADATFNSQLAQGLTSSSVLLVDSNTVSHDQALHPAPYGLDNVTTPLCDLTAAKNPLGSSLICSSATTIAGATGNYLFADSVHPTPYGYQLLAKYVSTQMAKRGWL